jgi:hypothetical protein
LVGLVLGWGVWLISELASGLFYGLRGSLGDEGLAFGLRVGLVFGLVIGLAVGLIVGLLVGGMACLRHLTLRSFAHPSRVCPLRYVRFLEEATERLFLRRAGSGYIFVHRLLLEHFADLETRSLTRRS